MTATLTAATQRGPGRRACHRRTRRGTGHLTRHPVAWLASPVTGAVSACVSWVCPARCAPRWMPSRLTPNPPRHRHISDRRARQR